MGKVHRRGTAVAAKKANRRHGRNCRSAPATPTGFALDFRRREIGKRNRWRAVATWDLVDEDVAGRALDPEGYQVQLRATDKSGDPVETALQEESVGATGAEFSVHSGSAASNNWWRELNASGDVVKKTITGLTAGIATQVNFYAQREGASGTPRLKFEVWNVTDGVTLGGKNDDITSHLGGPRLYVLRTFTPVVGKTYEARVSWTSGTGIARFSHANWHALGTAAVWSQTVPGEDETPGNAVFGGIPRPRSWYYSARIRTLNRHAGTRCWSAWTSWTTPTIPVTGTTPGPPPPTGLVQTIDKVEGVRRGAWRVRARWNEVPWWVPPDDDVREGADRYIVQLQVSSQSDGTPVLNTRTVSIPADDADVGVLAKKDWLYRILGKRYYRSRVATVSEGKRGAFSAWTAWASPGGAPDPPTGVTWSNPTPSVLRAKWTEPADPTDVDRYRVKVIRQTDSVVVEDAYTTANRFTYHIPKADRTKNHRVKVISVEDPGTLDEDDTPVGWDTGTESSEVESSDSTDSAPFVGKIRMGDDSLFLDEAGLPRCRIFTSGALSISHDTDRYIRFGTESIDTLGAHDDAVVTDGVLDTPNSTFDLTLPAGSYLAFWRAVWETSGGNGRREVFLHDTTGSIVHREVLPAGGTTVTIRHTYTFDLEFSSTTVLQAGCRQNDGGAINLQSGSRLLIIRLGPL